MRKIEVGEVLVALCGVFDDIHGHDIGQGMMVWIGHEEGKRKCIGA
jgi:hypothetical protein